MPAHELLTIIRTCTAPHTARLLLQKSRHLPNAVLSPHAHLTPTPHVPQSTQSCRFAKHRYISHARAVSPSGASATSTTWRAQQALYVFQLQAQLLAVQLLLRVTASLCFQRPHRAWTSGPCVPVRQRLRRRTRQWLRRRTRHWAGRRGVVEAARASIVLQPLLQPLRSIARRLRRGIICAGSNLLADELRWSEPAAVRCVAQAAS